MFLVCFFCIHVLLISLSVLYIKNNFLCFCVFHVQLSVTIDDDDTSSMGHSEERKEIANMVRQKMKKMEIPPEEYGMASFFFFLYHSVALKLCLSKLLKRMKGSNSTKMLQRINILWKYGTERHIVAGATKPRISKMLNVQESQKTL